MSVVPHLFVAGLGNLPYPATRHSVGHLIIDSLATVLGTSLSYDGGTQGYHGHTSTNQNAIRFEVTLFKSKMLMNVSGPSIVQMLRKRVRYPHLMVLIHDSLGHKVGVVSPRLGGSANGHNGVKSVISAVGTPEFHRLRIGIGRNEIDAVEYVMQRLSNYERQTWSPGGAGIDLVLQQLGMIAAVRR